MSVATLGGLALVNATLIVLLLSREGRGERWVQLLPYYGLGLVAAVAECALIALVRRAVGA